MAKIEHNLWVKTGTLKLPGKDVPFWGFAKSEGSEPQLPGCLIEGQVGDEIKITLNNVYRNITEPVRLVFPGLTGVKMRIKKNKYIITGESDNSSEWDSTDDDWDRQVINISTMEYTFKPKKPGIFLYESGVNPDKQLQMGLYGVMVIRPRGYNLENHPNFHKPYGDGTGSKINHEHILVLGEIDSKMHCLVNPNENYNMLNFNPDYWTINGRSFPHTLDDNDNSSQPYSSKIKCKVGDKILLRVINSGFQEHTFYLGGLIGKVIAVDSFPLRRGLVDATYKKLGITLGSGQSFDAIFVPKSKGELYFYSREYNHILNNNEFPGGMMTMVEIE